MKHRICFVDAFDSFSNNIVGLLERVTDADVTTINIHVEQAAKNLGAFLKEYDAIVIGPGPGHPANQVDTGLITQIWSLADRDLLPVLGICLGFQSLCVAHGASVKQLKRARHGIVTEIEHCDEDIFQFVGTLHATQYHSLSIDLGHEISATTGRPEKPYEATQQCPTLLPLAWDFDPISGPVLTGVKHSERPFWGLQFHPESICTSTEAHVLVKSWWQKVCAWNCLQGREVSEGKIPPLSTARALKASLTKSSSCSTEFGQGMATVLDGRASCFDWRKVDASHLTPTKLCETLDAQGSDVILLDSQGHKTGRFSILGLIVPEETVKLTYNVPNRVVTYGRSLTEQCSVQLESIEEIWPVLQQTLDSHNPLNSCHKSSTSFNNYNRNFIKETHNRECPFWGGFMGYISYGAGLETIQVDVKYNDQDNSPDINLAFIQRSIVFDHVESCVYIQSLLPEDQKWMSSIQNTIVGLTRQQQQHLERDLKRPSLDAYLAKTKVSRPEEAEYRAKVRTCQISLASGDSYELCLTDRTNISVPAIGNQPLDPWQLYLRLRSRNAAPMGSFIRLGGTTICSSSPERFLSWSRDGHTQFRPIKGTVKKGSGMTSERAHEILNSSKERAENLMIVDLVRHDLSGVIGSENVTVPKLMVVEEYETVWQLVSVIEGELEPLHKDFLQGKAVHPTGIDVLKASLPPGSMTGAPKKRSCEILQKLETKPRGVYSGVIGYLDVGGGGDWAVVIRTAVSHSEARRPVSNSSSAYSSDTEDESLFEGDSITSTIHHEPMVWTVGAGGAVTIQSTDEDEFLEMETKANSVLAAFVPNS